MTNHTATVETLTAEVRVLMVGSRQVTLSVYKQLDEVPLDQIEPFGRVRTGARDRLAQTDRWGMTIDPVELVGRHIETGELCRALVGRPRQVREWYDRSAAVQTQELWAKATRLPLIVLAGLR